MDYLEIKGYKSIKGAKVELLPINILIGSNGSGKSNFISFFEFLNKLNNQTLKEYVGLNGGFEKFLHKGIKNTTEISFNLEFESGKNGYSATLSHGDNGFIFSKELLVYNQDSGKNIAHFTEESAIKTTDNYRSKYILEHLENLKKFHFHDTGKKSPFTHHSSKIKDIYYLYENGENLAAFLWNIREKNQIAYRRIIKTIQSIAPYFLDFNFPTNADEYIPLLWTDKYSSILYSVNNLSDGTLRFIALTTLFLQPNPPKTIIIDEPELGLHPTAIAKLAGMIKSASLKGAQVILATQSADLINHFEPKDIITVDLSNGESVFNRLDKADLNVWMEEYNLGIGDLWQQNIITNGQPYGI